MSVAAPPEAVDVRTNALGGSPLVRDLLAGVGAVRAWYPETPTTPAAWLARVNRVSRQDEWLDALWPAFDAHGEAAARLRRAAAAGVLVTTGQQPGLFGGPIYTWSKAVSALALADALQACCGIPVAPVFWAATDDSDQREARATWISVPGGATELSAPGTAPDGTILGAVPLGDLSDALARLTAATGAAVYPEALAAVTDAYRQGATSGGAYLALLRRVLEPLGIAVLDASHAAVRRAAFPTLRAALERAPEIAGALAARSAAITDAGFSPQVADVKGLSLVFAYEGSTKRRVPLVQARASAGTATADALGPNVLLRPIVESAILPTVAYMAGPGEMAYFAQVGPVAEALGLPVPLAVPRWSGTLIEPHVGRLLRRRNAQADDFRDPHEPERRLARAALPQGLPAAFGDLRAALAAGMERVEGAARPLDMPPPPFQGALRSMAFKLDRLERRLGARAKRVEHEAMAELATVRGALYPNGVPQERALNFTPLLARYGPALLDAMRLAARQHADSLVG